MKIKQNSSADILQTDLLPRATSKDTWGHLANSIWQNSRKAVPPILCRVVKLVVLSSVCLGAIAYVVMRVLRNKPDPKPSIGSASADAAGSASADAARKSAEVSDPTRVETRPFSIHRYRLQARQLFPRDYSKNQYGLAVFKKHVLRTLYMEPMNCERWFEHIFHSSPPTSARGGQTAFDDLPCRELFPGIYVAPNEFIKEVRFVTGGIRKEQQPCRFMHYIDAFDDRQSYELVKTDLIAVIEQMTRRETIIFLQKEGSINHLVFCALIRALISREDFEFALKVVSAFANAQVDLDQVPPFTLQHFNNLKNDESIKNAIKKYREELCTNKNREETPLAPDSYTLSVRLGGPLGGLEGDDL